ncbi:hypothetical protein [Streptomonospora wellingtoniae]|uniref:Uncharacterized protein n=1 Tax=Streptomonospora wellingtoniae TaxID=3075544 RepID=A0ABU2KUU3_9ACTN|nr:hypothetical protein [Streptomonospora sp. DSM 45055]MDT0302932.1 hypothetical protein [Streptomonospora sp. DSM 45055]
MSPAKEALLERLECERFAPPPPPPTPVDGPSAWMVRQRELLAALEGDGEADE